MYFDFCRDIGVINVSECPEIVRIDEKDIHELISIRDGGVSEKKNLKFDNNNNYNDNNTIVVYEGNNSRAITTISDFKTVITDQWEVFDDVMDSASNGTSLHIATSTNPFVDSLSIVHYIPVCNTHILPDLIVLQHVEISIRFNFAVFHEVLWL